MLLHCDIAGRKTAYRPRFLRREADAIRLRGFLPLRIGAVVEFAQHRPARRARVANCRCSGDGLFVIDLQVLED